MTEKERDFILAGKPFHGTEQKIEADLWQYFDSIEERSQGVIPADAPPKKDGE